MRFWERQEGQEGQSVRLFFSKKRTKKLLLGLADGVATSAAFHGLSC
jgi:hypothetical protein